MVVKIQFRTEQKEGTRLATERQIDYLKMLAKEANYMPEKSFEEATMEEASKLIDILLEKVNQAKPGDKKEPEPKPRPIASKSDYTASARLGLAFKVTFQKWVRRYYDGKCVEAVSKDTRASFIKDVLFTYDMINEAAQKAGLQ